MASSAKVSVIIAAYNAASTIRACLDSLLTQSVPSEIILIDDGSTDGTFGEVEKYGEKVRLLRQKHLGPATARNLGVSEARGEIVVFADADMTFDRDYLRVLTAPIREGDDIGTFTHEEYVANWENPIARAWNIQEGWALRKRFSPNPPEYGTDFRAIRKEAFVKVGGFDDTGYTDTWTLFQKLGKRPKATKAVCYHQNPESLEQVFRHAKWVGKRPYKYGLIGKVVALVRASLPISLIVGLYKAIEYGNLHFLIFKIVYDLGIFLGITELILTGKTSK